MHSFLQPPEYETKIEALSLSRDWAIVALGGNVIQNQMENLNIWMNAVGLSKGFKTSNKFENYEVVRFKKMKRSRDTSESDC